MNAFLVGNITMQSNLQRKTSDESILKNKDKMINYTESIQNNYTGKKFFNKCRIIDLTTFKYSKKLY